MSRDEKVQGAGASGAAPTHWCETGPGAQDCYTVSCILVAGPN